MDGHADQYALAATAYHLLTGMPPFQHTNPAIVISQHLSSRPARDRKDAARTCRAGSGVRKALAKDAADRYPRLRRLRARSAPRPRGGRIRARRRARNGALTDRRPAQEGRLNPLGRHAKPESGASRGRRMLIPAILGAVVIGAGAAAGVSMLFGHRDAHRPLLKRPPRRRPHHLPSRVEWTCRSW